MKKRELEALYKKFGSIPKLAAHLQKPVLVTRQMLIDKNITLNRVNSGGIAYARSEKHKETPGAIEYIDRDELVEGYNARFGTNYLDMKELLRSVYSEQGSTYRVGEILGIAHTTAMRWMSDYELPRGPKGGRHAVLCLDALKKLRRLDRWSLGRICKEIGHSRGWIRRVMIANNLKCKDFPRERKNDLCALPEIPASDGHKNLQTEMRFGNRLFGVPRDIELKTGQGKARSRRLNERQAAKG